MTTFEIHPSSVAGGGKPGTFFFVMRHNPGPASCLTRILGIGVSRKHAEQKARRWADDRDINRFRIVNRQK